jgi:hypothetical protein
MFRRNLLSLSSEQSLVQNYICCHVLQMGTEDQDWLEGELGDGSKGNFDFYPFSD